DVGAFGHVLKHFGEVEELVEPDVRGEVEDAVEESEEPDHAAEADQIGEFEELAERADGEGEDQEADGPIAGEMGDELDGVGGEVFMPGAPAEPEEGRQAEEEERDFDPAFA